MTDAREAPPIAARPPLIAVDKLVKRYGNVFALRGVEGVVDGKIIGLLGPNGSGKSTLLKCLLGIIPFEGSARVLGLSSATEGVTIRDRVGYMPEQEAYLSGLNAVEQCTYAAELSGLPRTEAIQRAHAALYYAGIEDKRYQPIDGYSTGMKQAVKLAQALVHDPEILFLDEPTNGLDPRAREAMLKLIMELPERRNCAIVLSTHLLADVERVCDHAMIMHQGVLRFVGTIDELRGVRGEDTDVIVEVKIDAQKLADALSAQAAASVVFSPVALSVSLPLGETSALVFRVAKAVGVQVRGVTIKRMTMEDAFLKVIAAANAAAAAASGITPSEGPRAF